VKLIILDEAVFEFQGAVIYYEKLLEGLGIRFRNEADAIVRWIQYNPQILRVRSSGYRRANLKTFPYYIPYIIRNKTIWILAFAHTSRKPQYWIERQVKK